MVLMARLSRAGHRSGWPRVLLACAAILATMSACHSHPPVARSGASPARTGSAVPAPRGSAGGTTVSVLAQYQVNESAVSGLALWSHYLAFASAGPGAAPSANQNRIDVIDTDTGSMRTVAHSAYPTGLTDWLAGTGDWLVWTDQPREQEDGSMEVAWKIHLTNLVTGADHTVATSSRAERFVPEPSAGDGYIVWSQLQSSGTGGELHVLAAGQTGQSRVVARNVAPSAVGVSAGYAVYDGDSAAGRDVYEVPVGGGTPVRVSTSGKVLYPSAGGGRVVWQEPPSGDPTALWQARLGSAPRPTPVLSGVRNAGNAVAGTNFVAYWNTEAKTVVVGLTGDSAAPPLLASDQPAAVPPRIAASDNRVAWAEFNNPNGDADRALITLARVTAPSGP